MSDKKDDPRYRTPAYDVMAQQWHVVRSVVGGTPVMREAGEEFLPKNPLESQKNYEKRLARVSFFNVFKETKVGMAGMIFRKEAQLSDDVPETILEHTEDIDLMGNDIDEFAFQIFDEACTVGHVFGFVDFTINSGVSSLAEERALGLRPYWVKIPAENLLSWRIRSQNGKQITAQIVIQENITEPAGDFLEVHRRQYRVIREKDWQLWKHILDKDGDETDEVRLDSDGINTLGEVPLTIFNFSRQGMFESRPPLLDLAYENIAHWQSRSDHRNSLHFSSVAVLTISGRPAADRKKDLAWAADSVLDLPANATAQFLEHKGSALSATREELKDIEARMARQGLSFVVEGDPDVKATKLKQDKAEGDSKLAKMVGELRRGMTQMLSLHQKWLTAGTDDQGGQYLPNDDFKDRSLSPEMVGRWAELVDKGQVSLETMWDALIEGDVFPKEFDKDIEIVRLNDELSKRMRTEAEFLDNDTDPNDDPNASGDEDDPNAGPNDT